MKFAIRWARGVIRVDVNLGDQMMKVLQEICGKYKLDYRYCQLFYDELYTKPIPVNGSVQNARIKPMSFVFMKVDTTIPDDIKFAQMTLSTNIGSQFLAEGEKMTPEMKRIQAEYGPRAVSAAFFEHKQSLKPKIEYQDESSCYAFRIGEEAIKRFRIIAFQENFATHRITFLFGRINEVTGKITVHVSCEPQQVNEPNHVTISDSFDPTIPLQIAECFGMKCVGMAISHQPNSKMPMTPYMVQLAAFYQNMYGEYFTTLVVTPQENNEISVEAFQVSDAAMQLDREQIWNPVDFTKETKEITFKEELFVYNSKKKSADVNLFLCAVRVRLTHSKFPSHSFPCLSQNPTLIDLKKHLDENEFCPSWRQLFDFNLLVFIVANDIFTIEHDIPIIVNDIIQKQEIPSVYMEMIQNIIASI